MIKSKFEKQITKLNKLLDIYPFENKDAYCDWMNQQYYLIQNSTRYLALALSLIQPENSSEFKWWCKHLNEEMDHDKSILRDLKILNYVELKPLTPEMRAVISAQYEDLRKNGPDALLGYILFLEGASSTKCSRLAERIESAHGGKSTYMRLHADADLEHFNQGIERILSFPSNRQDIIIQNLEMMSYLYLSFFENLLSKHIGIAKAA